ncbi:MAG: flagellar hook-associated protein FlgL [Ignavibacteriales bacterium]|nr:flagellar hook-associated protein FlgL [Ignavibacteriales bacterium]
MRITENQIASSFLSSINYTQGRITDLQSQLATGKRVLKVSDDPQATERILRLNTQLQRNDTFQKNIDDAVSTLDTTASALNDFSNVLIKVKDIAIQTRNGSRLDAYPALAQQIDQFIDEALNTANTKFNGKYIFGGVQTTNQPYTIDAGRTTVSTNAAGITGTIAYPVGEGFSLQVNVDGQQAFQGTQIFNQLIQLRDALKAGTAPTNAQMDALDAAMDNVLGAASKAGALQTNCENIKTQLQEQQQKLRALLSDQQDVDVAQSAVDLKKNQTMLEAALSTGANILPKTLLDYLR